ncbi:hypothetical protein ASG32_03385 [Methylobacterium sp. Leaf361]|nr:hypothetical protein ASG32_03385 [Methylobacterium sp. Leaf361]
MPNRSRSGVVSSPARVVAPTSVNFGSSILTERAAGLAIDSQKIALVRGVIADRDPEPVAQRRRQQPRSRRGADQRELRQLDLDRARRRALADDQVELVILHGRVEDLLDRRVEPVDLVDEQDVALLQVGELGGQIPGLGDHRPGGRAEVHAEFARHDLRQRGLAEPGRDPLGP